MAAKMVLCAKLGQELPGIDADSPDGSRRLRMVKLIAPQLAERVANAISKQAMDLWDQHMLMVMNEYRLDPTSDAANKILAEHMEAFLFGESAEIPNYTPPTQ